MCLLLETSHIKKSLSLVLHDILRPHESHLPVAWFFIYRVQQNRQKNVSVLVPDEGHRGVIQHAIYLLYSDNGYCQQRKPPFISEFLYVQN
jgi:hypothetical protein